MDKLAVTTDELQAMHYVAKVSETGRNIHTSDDLLRPAVAEYLFDRVVHHARMTGDIQVMRDYRTKQVCVFVNCGGFMGCAGDRIYYLARPMLAAEAGCYEF